jgi:hypothetical protein
MVDSDQNPNLRVVTVACGLFRLRAQPEGRRETTGCQINLARGGEDWFILGASRMWWNWQTRYFEVVVPQGVQVQVLPCAPKLIR